MTETEWLTTTFRAYDMLRHVRARATARKLQLLACGCCRLVSEHLTDDQRKLLDVIERHADGLTTVAEYERVVDECGRASNEVTERFRAIPRPPTRIEDAAVYALQAVVCTPADAGLQRTVERVIEVAGLAGGSYRREANQRIQQQVCDLFREVVGDPFAERMVVGPEWVQSGGTVTGRMTRVGETARTLAVGIQVLQAFDRMPILADALEEDGCSDAELLAHLRDPRPHARGCWALDLVLGKS
jgi:hypothetical protein